MTAPAPTYPAPGNGLWPIARGETILPHQAQMILRDLHGEHIRREFGATAMAYRLTAEDFAERCTTGRGGMPYEFLWYAPETVALNWTAFRTRADMAAFMAAYALTIDREPEPGERFTVQLPADDRAWLPLSGPPTIGERCTVRGGFEEGLAGYIVANEPDRSRRNPYGSDRPYRYRVRVHACDYCGIGPCSGSPRTANGADVDAWYAVHSAAVPSPGTVGGLHPVDLELAEPRETVWQYGRGAVRIWARDSAGTWRESLDSGRR